MTQTHNGASVGIVRDGKVLLIKRAFAPFQHLWSFPGGGWEDGESIEECAAREVKEELGLAVRNLRPVATQSVGRERSYRIAVFATTDFSGVIRPSDEVSDHKWADPGMLPALRTTSRLDEAIRECFKVLGQSW